MANKPASKEYYLSAVIGSEEGDSDMGDWGTHQVGVKVLGPLTAGTLTISARSPGGSVFELVPGGVVDLMSPVTVLFKFVVGSYKFDLSGITGESSSTQVVVTDIPIEL